MPRDPSGIYTLPPGTDAIPNRTILSSPYNLSVHDIEADLNTPRPVISGGTGSSTASGALTNLGAVPKSGIGQCILIKSGANLLLSPKYGNQIMINGAMATIPDAGVSLTTATMAAQVVYYIYAYLNVAVMTLEYSATAYTAQAGTGALVKIGDPTRTLVGMVRTNVSTQFVDAPDTRYVRSFFNRVPLGLFFILPADRATTSVPFAPTGDFVNWLQWSDETVFLQVSALSGCSAAGAIFIGLYVDGVFKAGGKSNTITPGTATLAAACNVVAPNEGLHSADLRIGTNSGTQTLYSGGYTNVIGGTA
jgi:hypothetical protein